MDLQFIKLLEDEITFKYSFLAYAKKRLCMKMFNQTNLDMLGVPFIVSFAKVKTDDREGLANIERAKEILLNIVKNNYDYRDNLYLPVFLFNTPKFELTQIPLTISSKHSIGEIEDLKLINKPIMFMDHHIQVNIDMEKDELVDGLIKPVKLENDITNNVEDLSQIPTYSGNVYKRLELAHSINIANPYNIRALVDKYRFVNFSFNNVNKSNIEKLLNIIEQYIQEFNRSFKYTNLLSDGHDTYYATVDKVNITYFKYEDFFPTFINDDIYCLLIQLTSSIFDNISYYTRNYYVLNYILGGSDNKDDLMELDGEKNVLVANHIDIAKFIWAVLKNFTLKKGERSMQSCAE